MANKQRGEVPFQHGDLESTLKFDFNAIAELESILDSDFTSIMNNISNEKISIKFVRAAVYAGLQHDRRIARGLTLRKVGTLINKDNLQDVTHDVLRAILLMQGVDLDKLEEKGASEDAEDPTKVTEKSTDGTGTD